MPHTPARTANSNGSRYSSRRAGSSMTEFIVRRSVSESLPTRCLATAPTPRFCKPVIQLAPSTLVSNGSSENVSNARPASGLRGRLRFGPRTAWTLRRRASSPISSPIRRTRSVSQDAASEVPQGASRDTSRSSIRPLVTPIGPSTILIGLNAMVGASSVCAISRPAVMRALSSVERRSTNVRSSVSVTRLRDTDAIVGGLLVNCM